VTKNTSAKTTYDEKVGGFLVGEVKKWVFLRFGGQKVSFGGQKGVKKHTR